jgi:CDP-diacylglycerol--serine O-phosphatidyltransferase
MPFSYNPLRKINIPNNLTILNLISGFLALYFASNNAIALSIILLMFAFLFDFADGFIARKFSLKSDLGKELDSLADSLSFVLVPAFIVYFYIFGQSFYGLVSAVFIVISGYLRLGIFNTKKSRNYFEGLATPMFTLLIMIITLALRFKMISQINDIVMSLLIIMASLLMIINIRFPSFKDKGLEIKIGFFVYTMLAGIVFLLFLYESKYFLYALIGEYALFLLMLIILATLKSFRKKAYLIWFIALFIVGATLLIYYDFFNFLIFAPIAYSVLFSPLIYKAFE